MSDTKKTPLTEFRDAAVAASAKAIMETLPPEQLNAIAREILTKTLDGAFGAYSSLSRQIEEEAKAVLQSYLENPDIKAEIRKQVRAAVDEKMPALRTEAAAKFTELAMKGLSSAIESSRKGY